MQPMIPQNTLAGLECSYINGREPPGRGMGVEMADE